MLCFEDFVYEFTLGNTIKIEKYTGSETELVIPKVIVGKPVKKIGHMAFHGCESLTTVIIPDGVEEIEDYTFASCKNLQSITIPKSVEKIGYSAFLGCESLQNVTIPNGVVEIGGGAFENNNSIKSIIIPETVKIIHNGAFNSCEGLTKIIILNKNCEIEDDIDSPYHNLGRYRSKGRLTICNICTIKELTNTFFGLMDIYTTKYSGVIVGYRDSTAEKYAKGYCRFESID